MIVAISESEPFDNRDSILGGAPFTVILSNDWPLVTTIIGDNIYLEVAEAPLVHGHVHGVVHVLLHPRVGDVQAVEPLPRVCVPAVYRRRPPRGRLAQDPVRVVLRQL